MLRHPSDSMPLVSVITPSYNRGWIIQSCLNSVRNQTYTNVEHLVIDGLSTDETVKVLEQNLESYNLRWVSEKDQGMYDAINKGVAQSNGEIVTYLNTDDFYFPYSLDLVVRAFGADPELDIIYGDWVTYYTESGFVEVMCYPSFDRFDLARYACLPQTAVFMRRRVFDRTGAFDISYKLMADNEFFSRAVARGAKIAKIWEVLAGQTVHAGNLLAGNVKAVGQATNEANRYRQTRKIELMATAGIAYRLGWLAAGLRAKTYPLTWRMLLVRFLVSLRLGVPDHWRHFRAIVDRDRFSTPAMFRYLASRKINQAARYYVVPQFEPMAEGL